jgi:flagellar motor switch protein FliG
MILNTKTSEETLSGLRKAAMLLVVLGEQASADLLQQLAEEDVQKVSREVARITAISSEQAEQVLKSTITSPLPAIMWRVAASSSPANC